MTMHVSTIDIRILPGAAAVLLALATPAWAAPFLMVDDFSTGDQNRVIRSSGIAPTVVHRVQTGDMEGGVRTTHWQFSADSGVGDPMLGRDARFEVGGDRLVLEHGCDISYRIDLDWGYDRRGDANPLDIDLEPIRESGELTVRFHSLDTVAVVVAVLITEDGADTFVGETEVAPLATPQAVSLDLASFISNVSSETPGEDDLADVDRITVIVQSGGLATDFALDSVEFNE